MPATRSVIKKKGSLSQTTYERVMKNLLHATELSDNDAKQYQDTWILFVLLLIIFIGFTIRYSVLAHQHHQNKTQEPTIKIMHVEKYRLYAIFNGIMVGICLLYFVGLWRYAASFKKKSHKK